MEKAIAHIQFESFILKVIPKFLNFTAEEQKLVP